VFLTDGPRVFAVLLNYQTAGDTVRCLASLRRNSERDIRPVIVDNASGNGDVARMSVELGPAIPILESPHNVGYAAGNNLGIQYALDRDADYVWIVNPDTEVEPDTLQLLMATMALRPGNIELDVHSVIVDNASGNDDIAEFHPALGPSIPSWRLVRCAGGRYRGDRHHPLEGVAPG
jgi:GT2 family glycosyltransferase